MRVFIGFSFEDEIKEYLFEQSRSIADKCEKGRFTRLENFHMTLKFIGNVEEEDIDSIKKAMRLAADGAKSIEIEMDRVSHFEKKKRKILWYGIKKNEYVENLQRRVDEELSRKLEIKMDDEYIPHITIGRNIIADEETYKANIYSKKIRISRLTLFHSTNIEGILSYVPIFEVDLEQEF